MAAAEAATVDDDSGGHPLEGQRVLRLALITISCMICSGTVPGMGLFVQMLVEAGVGSSLCDSGLALCDEQYLFVSEAFDMAAGVGFLFNFFVGWLFDRFGGHVLSQLGAGILAVGFALIQVPLLGAHFGHDGQTRSWLLPAILIADTGAMLNTMAVMSIVWHFPDLPSVVSVCSSATYHATAVLPIILSALMRATGLSLSSIMLGWLVLVALACACCYFTVPTMEEYRSKAVEATGTPLQPADETSLWQMFLDANAVLLPRWWMNAIAILTGGACSTFVLVYTSLLGDLGEVLFSSQAKGTTLASIYNICTGVSSAILCPLVACANDILGQGGQSITMIIASLFALSMLASIFVAQTTLSAQVVTCVSNSLFYPLFIGYGLRYALAFAGPARVGSVSGLMNTYSSLVYLALSHILFTWMASLPSSDPTHLTVPLQVGSVFATALLAVLDSCILTVGLPEEPVTLAEHREEVPSLQPKKL